MKKKKQREHDSKQSVNDEIKRILFLFCFAKGSDLSEHGTPSTSMVTALLYKIRRGANTN